MDATHPKIQAFLRAWHEDERARFDRNGYMNLVYDEYAPKSAHDRRKYIALDRAAGAAGRSGVYLVDRATERVYTIKAYGVPNRFIGTLDDMLAQFATHRHAVEG